MLHTDTIIRNLNIRLFYMRLFGTHLHTSVCFALVYDSSVYTLYVYIHIKKHANEHMFYMLMTYTHLFCVHIPLPTFLFPLLWFAHTHVSYQLEPHKAVAEVSK